MTKTSKPTPGFKLQNRQLKKLNPRHEVNYWDQVDQLAQPQILQLVIKYLPLTKHQLSLEKDVDYRSTLADLRDYYESGEGYQKVPHDPQTTATELAICYLSTVLTSLITELQDYEIFYSTRLSTFINSQIPWLKN